MGRHAASLCLVVVVGSILRSVLLGGAFKTFGVADAVTSSALHPSLNRYITLKPENQDLKLQGSTSGSNTNMDIKISAETP
jgi:hypothetical protein